MNQTENNLPPPDAATVELATREAKEGKGRYLENIAAKNPAALICGKRCPTCKSRDLCVFLGSVPYMVECLACGDEHRAEDLEDVPAKAAKP